MEGSMNMKRLLSIGFLVLSLAVIGCGTSGKEFNADLFESIQNGHTTQQEVESMFGHPFKKGIQNKREVWVYEYNKYRMFGSDTSKDMVIIFDDSGVVENHQYMASKPKTK